jgi:FkbM family methyltransferase
MPDFMPHHSSYGKRIGHLGKKIAPRLSQFFLRRPFTNLIRYASMYLELIQGKGSGSYWNMSSEAQVAKNLIDSEPAVVFDVGAHNGMWSQAVMDTLHVDCHVYQFEPAEHHLGVLRRKTKNKNNITLVEKAVSNEEGRANFHFSESASDASSLHFRRDSLLRDATFKTTEVQTTTIDTFVSDRDIRRIDFLKLDIEGHELHALQGAVKSLKGNTIISLAFEFGSGNINSRTYFRDFWELLTPFGYSIYRICPGGVMLPIEQYYEDLEYFRGVTNYVATLKEV